MMKYMIICIMLLTANIAVAGKGDTIKIYFDLAVPTLNTAAMRYLDSLGYHDILRPGSKYGIIGYADYLGSEESNITLSQNRAGNVREYLQGLGIKPEHIETVTGKGEVNRDRTDNEGYPEDRRVDIVIGGFEKHAHDDSAMLICYCGNPDCKKNPARKVAVKKSEVMWSIYFEENTMKENSGLKLKPGQDSTIANLCKYLKANNVNIQLMGYYYGSNENVGIAVDRAEYIDWRLKECGILPGRISAAGHGLLKLTPGQTPGDLRRVDVKIVGRAAPPPPVVVEKPIKQIDISSAKEDEVIRLDNIFFLPGSHRIREESTETLFSLYIAMKDHPSLKINIEGHICCLTNTTHDGYDYDAQEYRLSENRARAVYDYLAEKGIEKERMSYTGFGISKPLVWPERSVRDENLNRRVEIRILER